MKIVLDTNVLVSGLLYTDSACGKILDLVLNQEVQLLYDARIVAEYIEVLKRPKFNFDPYAVDMLIDFILHHGQEIIPSTLKYALKDPFDVPFVEAAIAGKAHGIVTGNVKDYVYKSSRKLDVRIYQPAAFLKLFLKR